MVLAAAQPGGGRRDTRGESAGGRLIVDPEREPGGNGSRVRPRGHRAGRGPRRGGHQPRSGGLRRRRRWSTGLSRLSRGAGPMGRSPTSLLCSWRLSSKTLGLAPPGSGATMSPAGLSEAQPELLLTGLLPGPMRRKPGRGTSRPTSPHERRRQAVPHLCVEWRARSVASSHAVVAHRANVQNGRHCTSRQKHCASRQKVDARSRPRCGVPPFSRPVRQEE